LKTVLQTNDQGQVAEAAKKLRGGMNRDQFEKESEKGKNANADDGDKEYYFDCKILEKLESNTSQPAGELRTDQNIDLMDFISKSDFSTVNNQQQQPSNNVEFDFDNFNSNTQQKQKTVDEFFAPQTT
jgi:hypothetical protein